MVGVEEGAVTVTVGAVAIALSRLWFLVKVIDLLRLVEYTSISLPASSQP